MAKRKNSKSKRGTATKAKKKKKVTFLDTGINPFGGRKLTIEEEARLILAGKMAAPHDSPFLSSQQRRRMTLVLKKLEELKKLRRIKPKKGTRTRDY